MLIFYLTELEIIKSYLTCIWYLGDDWIGIHLNYGNGKSIIIYSFIDLY